MELVYCCFVCRTHQSVPSARYLGCCGIGCGTWRGGAYSYPGRNRCVFSGTRSCVRLTNMMKHLLSINRFVCFSIFYLKERCIFKCPNMFRCTLYLRCSSCCWMRYCCCKAWGRKGGGTSWYWGGGRWGGGNSAGRGVAVAARWKCRQEVAWLCWCLLKCAPVRDNQSQNRVHTTDQRSATTVWENTGYVRNSRLCVKIPW